jgi:hypothetical protein
MQANFWFSNISFVKYNKVCFRSAKETSLSIYNPSTWWKMQCERDDMASLRNTSRRNGSDRRFIVFHVTHFRRCVRTQQNIKFWIKKYPASRAGWYSAGLEQWNYIVFISGPSDTLKPIAISIIWFLTIEMGWRDPWLQVQQIELSRQTPLLSSLLSSASWIAFTLSSQPKF